MCPALITKRVRVLATWVFLAAFLGGMAVSGRASAAGGDFIKPLAGSIILRFAAKYYDKEAGKTRTHHGLDIAAPAGSRVNAAADGKVTFAGQTPVGLCVSILHKNGIKTTYLPLAYSSVSRGEIVSQGQKIGATADTGDKSSSIAHLHMGAILAGEYIDPEALLTDDYKADLTKLIRRGNIPPFSEPSVMTPAGGIAAWPVVAAITRLFNGGANLITRFWNFLGQTGSYLSKQANFFWQTGLGFVKKGFRGWNDRSGSRRPLSFSRISILGLRQPGMAGSQGITVFDPSGDRDETDSRLYISLAAGRSALSVDIYGASANLVKRLNGWDRTADGIYWLGDDSDGKIVEPGLYSVVVKFGDGSARVVLAEVRWHL